MPGSTPAISQLDWLSSTTAMIVLSWSKAARDLLKSFSWGIRALPQLFASDDGAISSPLPHTISSLEEAGFELTVPLCDGGVATAWRLDSDEGVARSPDSLLKQ